MRHITVTKQNLTSIHFVDAADREKSCRFAAARWPKQSQHLAVLHGEIHVFDDCRVTEVLGKTLDDDFHQPFIPPP